MRDFDRRLSFGPATAARYDDRPRGDEAAAVDFLAEVAGSGRSLEFAIGTGRIGLLLSERGVPVDGVELSPAMVDRLRQRPGGDRLRVEIGDMTTVDMGERYALVFLVYNTIFNLLTADDQVRCFENAARHLDQDGAFVVETALPHAWIPPGRPDYVRAELVELNEIGFDVARYDPATQLLTENHVRITADGTRFTPIVSADHPGRDGPHGPTCRSHALGAVRAMARRTLRFSKSRPCLRLSRSLAQRAGTACGTDDVVNHLIQTACCIDNDGPEPSELCVAELVPTQNRGELVS